MNEKVLCLLLALLCIIAFAACAAPDAPPEIVVDNAIVPETQGYTTIPGTPPEDAENTYEPLPTPDPEPIIDPIDATVTAILSDMTLEERVAQMFFVGCPSDGAAEVLAQYPVGGYILFGYHLADQTADEVRGWIASLQTASKIPLLIGVDEEGGTVVRVSANPALRAERFASPRKLYAEGGFARIAADAQEKSALLLSLGINVNLAPVCDLGFSPDDYIYDRSFGSDPAEVSRYVETVVTEMETAGIGSVLKHFPGYGAAEDTHTGIAIVNSLISDIRDAAVLPFVAGVEAGADAVMVCHNIVMVYDDARPASLSSAIHELLRETLGDDVVVMTDDLDMGGITDYTDGASAAVQAVLAGNDMLLTSRYESIDDVVAAVQEGTISEARINASVERILRWKIALGLIKTEGATT